MNHEDDDYNPFLRADIASQWLHAVRNNTGPSRTLSIIPIVKQWLDASEVKRVVDIGSGDGWVCEVLGDGVEYTGVEPSQTLLAAARERYGDESRRRRFLPGTAYRTSLPDSYCDAALSLFVLLHLRYPAVAFGEAARVLSAGGRILIISANPKCYHSTWLPRYEAYRRIDDGVIGADKRTPLAESSFYPHSDDCILSGLTTAGFTVVSYETFDNRGLAEDGLFVKIIGRK